MPRFDHLRDAAPLLVDERLRGRVHQRARVLQRHRRWLHIGSITSVLVIACISVAVLAHHADNERSQLRTAGEATEPTATTATRTTATSTASRPTTTILRDPSAPCATGLHPERSPLQAVRSFPPGKDRWAICGASTVFSGDLFSVRSTDGGKHWTATATGLTISPSHAGDHVTVTLDDFQHATIRLISPVVSRDDTYRTTDGGTTWRSTSPASKVAELRTVPAITGLPFDTATGRLRASGFTGRPAFYSGKDVANATIPAGVIVSQDPRPGTKWPMNAAINITVSAGGPAVAFTSLPAQAQTFARTLAGYDTTEPVLVSRTANGVAYKTDGWLYGPCPAVRAAYRTYRDPAYDVACY